MPTAAITTRLIRAPRHRSRRVLAIAFATVVINCGLVLALARLSRELVDHTSAPLLAMPIVQATAPSEPPPSVVLPPVETRRDEVIPAAPALDLAAPGPDPAALRLPPPSLDLPTSELALALPTASVVPSLPAATTAAMDELPTIDEEPPELLSVLDLARFYPRPARLRELTGESVVRLSITASGAVSACVVVSSAPAGVFDAAAERLGGSLRFRPARRGGRTVASTHALRIVWTLEEPRR
jgi:TonB family protein